ncbi:MAG TPA: RING finger protein [Candidatus Sulfotelmatobacter sp.]|nr:RING finger protein [Candidatus Sulfotelmatobacter sp.]
MTAKVCPYCRSPIGDGDAALACEGCGTPHHADCYAENGGCTIFGCSKAPGDEPKLRVSTPELVAVTSEAPSAPERHVPLPPPPPPALSSAGGLSSAPPVPSDEELRRLASSVVPSMFGSLGESSTASSEPEVHSPKSRTTYILLGALLGAFGAHSFYAGYHKKGGIQLAITLLSLGFAGPMSWVWAVIDICTISQDCQGVQFES